MKRLRQYLKSIKVPHIGDNQGFTLAEMVVALFIFMFIMVTIGAVFVNAITTQRRVLNALKVEENLSFVMEAIAKEIRFASVPPGQATFTNFTNTADCQNSPLQALTFYNSVGQLIVYSRDVATNSILRSVNGTSTTMNSSNVEFTKLNFCVLGNDPGQHQTRVVIKASIQSKGTTQQVLGDFQTTVTLRFLNI